jgi:hypothetical protein
MGMVVWVSAGASGFFFFFCAAAGDAADKRIAIQVASVKSARKLRVTAGTGFAAIGVLSLIIKDATEE